MLYNSIVLCWRAIKCVLIFWLICAVSFFVSLRKNINDAIFYTCVYSHIRKYRPFCANVAQLADAVAPTVPYPLGSNITLVKWCTLYLPRGGLVLGRCVGQLWCRVRLAALGWSDWLAHIDVSVFAETVITRCGTEVFLLALVLPVTIKQRLQQANTVQR